MRSSRLGTADRAGFVVSDASVVVGDRVEVLVHTITGTR